MRLGSLVVRLDDRVVEAQQVAVLARVGPSVALDVLDLVEQVVDVLPPRCRIAMVGDRLRPRPSSTRLADAPCRAEGWRAREKACRPVDLS